MIHTVGASPHKDTVYTAPCNECNLIDRSSSHSKPKTWAKSRQLGFKDCHQSDRDTLWPPNKIGFIDSDYPISWWWRQRLKPFILLGRQWCFSSVVQTKKKSLVASHFIGSTINTGQLTLCFVVVITNLHAMSLRMHCSVLISTCTMWCFTSNCLFEPDSVRRKATCL